VLPRAELVVHLPDERGNHFFGLYSLMACTDAGLGSLGLVFHALLVQHTPTTHPNGRYINISHMQATNDLYQYNPQKHIDTILLPLAFSIPQLRLFVYRWKHFYFHVRIVSTSTINNEGKVDDKRAYVADNERNIQCMVDLGERGCLRVIHDARSNTRTDVRLGYIVGYKPMDVFVLSSRRNSSDRYNPQCRKDSSIDAL
jgi:hypothetical protein